MYSARVSRSSPCSVVAPFSLAPALAMTTRRILGFVAGCLILGCNRAGHLRPDVAPPKVTVAPAIRREVVSFSEYTGRVQAVETVEVRARVSGYLTKVNFNDGDIVQKFADPEQDVPLFEIDSSTYDAALAYAKAQVALAEARYNNAEATRARNYPLFQKNAVSKEEYENLAAAAAESKAAVEAAKADQRLKELDVDFSRVKSPITGRIDRTFVTEGNLVQAGASPTLLTRIVSVDPIYIYFDVDELAFLRYTESRKQEEGGSIHVPLRDKHIPVEITLADGTVYPELGKIDFGSNQLDAATGTITVRATVPNSQGTLTPGLFVRVRIARGSRPENDVLVAEAAIGTSQSERFVYVVDDQNIARRRRVVLGEKQGNDRVIKEGLSEGEKVVINGLLLVRDDKPVTPEVGKMPEPPPFDKRLLRPQSNESAEGGGPAAEPSPDEKPTPHEVHKPVER